MSQIRLYFDEDAMDLVLATALQNQGVSDVSPLLTVFLRLVLSIDTHSLDLI